MSARRGSFVCALGCVLGVGLALPVRAAADGHIEVSARGGWWSGYSLGTREATLTGGQIPTGTPVTIFTTDVSIVGGPAAEIGLGWRLGRGVVIEATGGIGQLHLETRIRGDIEGAPALTTRSSLLQITVDGGARVDVPGAALARGRLRPFVGGGAGYLRQVHEGRLLVETGRTFFGGGGLTLAPSSTPRSFLGRVGLRADVRMIVRTGGVDTEDSARTFVSVTGGAFVRF